MVFFHLYCRFTQEYATSQNFDSVCYVIVSILI